MFEHADRDDPVEGTGSIAVVAEQEFRRSCQVLLRRTSVRDLQLFRRQRDARDIGAGHFGQIEAKATPARTDVEHTGPRARSEVWPQGDASWRAVHRRATHPGSRNRRSCIACRRRGRGNRAARRDHNGGRRCWCLSAPIELPDVPAEIAQPPFQPGPARHHFGLVEQDLERIRNRAVLDHERAVHIGFAERQFGIEEDAPLVLFAQKPCRHRLAGTVTAGKTGSPSRT